MVIAEAVTEDHEILTEITIASKSHWNYSEEQIKEWIPVLTISPDYINRNEVFKLIQNELVIGYYSYYSLSEDEVLLDNMFISPEFIGKGIGGKLMNDFLERVKSQKFKSVKLYSDPNSEEFYLHFGFTVIGQELTSIKNRFLPILHKLL